MAPLVAAQVGAETAKHSGTIIDVDPSAATMALAEVGPWRVERGQTVLTRRTIVLTDATEVVVTRRAAESPSGFPGDFVEEARSRWDLYSGDFVTVECLHEGWRLVALKIILVETPQ